MHFIGIDQNNAVLRCDVVSSGAEKSLRAFFNHANGVAFVAVPRKILFLVLGIQQF